MWFGPRTTAILLTGMGDDGVIGMGEIKANGGECIIQDEESAVVFGMPGEAKRLGFAEREMTLDEISRHVSQIPSNGS
jgi:two-component system chemotaxis response regulator CheB